MKCIRKIFLVYLIILRVKSEYFLESGKKSKLISKNSETLGNFREENQNSFFVLNFSHSN